MKRRTTRWVPLMAIGAALVAGATSGCFLSFTSPDDPLVTYDFDPNKPAIATVSTIEGVLEVRDGCLTILEPATSQEYTVVWPDDALWNNEDKTVTSDGTLYRLSETVTVPGAIWGATDAKPDFVRSPASGCAEALYVVA